MLVVDDEVDTVTNLLELAIVDDLGRVLVLTEDLAVLEAHAFVFGVYNGPCGGYGLVDAVSVALVVAFWLLLGIIDDDLLADLVDDLIDEVADDLIDEIVENLPVEVVGTLVEALLEPVLTGLLEDLLAETLDDLLAEMLDDLLAESMDDSLDEMLALLLDDAAEARFEDMLEDLLEYVLVTTLDGWPDDLLASRLLLEELIGMPLDVLVDLIALTGRTLDGALLRDPVVDDAANLLLDVELFDLLLGTWLLEVEGLVD